MNYRRFDRILFRGVVLMALFAFRSGPSCRISPVEDQAISSVGDHLIS